MSVLSFPRIYFRGFMEWDPCTFNNNDWQEFPTYDGVNAALNWSFLRTQGITPENFTTTFRPWAIKLQKDDEDSPRGPRVPAEWNMFGSHGVSFVQYQDLTSTITGGDLAYGKPAAGDPLIGQPVKISGDDGSGPGRLVDNNPFSFWSSQIYFGQMAFGSGDTTFSGPRIFRMHSRWLNLNRIYTTLQELTQPAASVGACFQTCIPFDKVTWPKSTSSHLIDTLRHAAQEPGALGVMIRFTAYVNLYFRNGVFNDIAARPSSYEELAAALAKAWDAFNKSGDTSLFFSQPCYSHIVGTVGVWNDHELVSVPGGRYLVAQTPVARVNPEAVRRRAVALGHALPNASVAAPPPVPLGPVVVQVDEKRSLISLDFGSAIPENGVPGQWPSDLNKANFGPLSLGVMIDGTFTPAVTIDYTSYQRSAYEASAGIIDIPFPDAGAGALLKSGPLAIQAQSQTALLEQTFAAQTDRRGIYLDQNEQTVFEVAVFDSGAPAAGAKVLVARYDGGLNLVPSDQAAMVNYLTGEQSTITMPNGSTSITTGVTVVTADANGIAKVGISAQSPSFAALAFFPFAAGAQVPMPAVSLFPPPFTTFVGNAFYTTVRLLPFDDAVPQAFVDLWNKGQNQAEAWAFVYHEILYVYDMLFSVMLEYVNLGDRKTVEGRIGNIWSLIAKEQAAESTYAMPITRDMSAGKRLALQLWIYLVANKFNVPGFNVSSIPPGWSPPSKSHGR
jgi:hypothetical protein